jgi:hypothetical protein
VRLLAFFNTRVDCLSPLMARPLHITSLQEFLQTPGISESRLECDRAFSKLVLAPADHCVLTCSVVSNHSNTR